MSIAATLVNALLRGLEKPKLARAQDPARLRRDFERAGRFLFHGPRGTQERWLTLQAGQHQTKALEIVPGELTSDAVIFYVHGGAFIMGSPRTHAAMLAQLAGRTGMRAVLPRYPLAPENPFPAASQAVRTAWEGLVAEGVAPQKIILGGDSAGGALAFGLLAELLAEQKDAPAAVFAFSPLTDLTFSGASVSSNAKADILLPSQRIIDVTEMYLGDQPADDPRVSPLFAELRGAPDVWLAVSTTEILYDDARRLAQQLTDDGVAVTLEARPHLAHVWPMLHNYLPEARQTLDRVAAWIKQQAPGSPSGS